MAPPFPRAEPERVLVATTAMLAFITKHGLFESQGSTSEFRRMHAGVACGTEGNQVVLAIVAGLAAKFLVMNLKI